MGRFLITVWPFPGHTQPNMAIARALKLRGHQVAVYTGPAARAVFEREGIRCFPFERVNEEELGRLLTSELSAASVLGHPLRRAGILRAWLVETLPRQVEDLSYILDTWQPDAVVSDVTMWAAPLILHEKRNIPVAVSLFMPGCMIPGPDAPPWGLGLPPPRDWRSRVVAGLVQALIDLFARKLRRRVSELRQSHGLPALPVDIHTFLGQMPLYLVPSSPDFDYRRRDLPPSVHYLGAMTWDKHEVEPAPAWLEELPGNQPLVHVTEGTMHVGSPRVLRAAAEGLAGLPLQVVMTSGKDRDPASLDLGPLASNIRLERWVPHSILLPRSQVMVTTGGGSTVVAGLRAGVPMVVVPTQWDKPDNAQRVVEAGVGLRLAPRHCTPGRLRGAVERILRDRSFSENARRLSAEFRRLGGAERAAGLIEGLLSTGVRRGEPLPETVGA